MSDTVTRLNAALEGRYRIERESVGIRRTPMHPRETCDAKHREGGL